MEQLIKNKSISSELDKIVRNYNSDFVFVLADENTYKYCYPLMQSSEVVKSAKTIIISPDDVNKSAETLLYIWKMLSDNGATRHSLLINLGGGVVTDIGGLAAATYKRGIKYFNIPTTLMAIVDAAVGGKTAINFNGYKNEIGRFYPAEYIFVSNIFLSTLPQKEILSGFAEMVKHALINSHADWDKILKTDVLDFSTEESLEWIHKTVTVKKHIVDKDPYEKDIRKALNLGHTIGHAFESFSVLHHNPIPHGYAVAYGLIAELYLSHRVCGFPADKLKKTVNYLHDKYGSMAISCDDYQTLYAFMKHDKKNVGESINFTLLSDIGNVKINQTADENLIFEAFDFYRDAVE